MADVIETIDIEDWDILSDDGWHPLTHVHKTIKYDVWELCTSTHTIKCADTHIVIDEHHREVYVNELCVGDRIITDTGIEPVISVVKLSVSPEHMYDVTVDSEDHTLFSNGILSHNSTMSSIFLLHYMLFHKDLVVAILANKESAAKSVLRTIKTAYKLLPLWLQQGVVSWNEKTLELENGMKLIAATTSSDSISGETVSLLYLDEFAKVKAHVAEDFITASLPTVSTGGKVIIVSCVVDDTFVITPNGIREVSDFVDYDREPDGLIGYEIDDYKVYGKSGFNDGNIIVNSGYVPTKIITSVSSEVECSLKHPWFVCDDGVYDWKKTKDITGNEYVAIQYGQDVWGHNDRVPSIDINNYSGSNVNDYRINTITKDFAYFLGLYISFGNACRRVKSNGDIYYTGINITCGDFVGDVFGRLGYKYSLETDGLHYTLNSVMLCHIMMSLGFDLSNTAKKKVIPKRLFEMSRDNVIAMIQGIMDGDGSSQKNRGTVCIKTPSKRLMQQMRTLFNNFGVLSTWVEGITPPTKLVKVSSQYYGIELNSTMSKKYYDIIGFRFERKQLNEKYLPETITRDRCDIIPYSKDVVVGLKQSHPKDYKLIVDHGVMKGNYKKNSHFSRMFMLRYKDFMLSLNNPILSDLYEFITDDIKWEHITSITDSNNDVYDFSLKEIDEVWCHSVLFNNILGRNTPLGMNHFYEFWAGAVRNDNAYYPIEVNWWEHPDRDEKWKKRELRRLNNSTKRFDQEYGNKFLGSAATLIEGDILKRLNLEQPSEYKWNGAFGIYELPVAGAMYVAGVDTAKGTGNDYSVIQVLRIHSETEIDQVAIYRCNTIDPHEYAQVCIGISKYYNDAPLMIENNDIGSSVTDTIWYEYEYDNIINLDPKGLGLRSTKKSKLEANLLLRRYANDKMLTIRDFDTISELSRYVEIRPNVWQGETKTTHDDCVTSLLWALYFITTAYFDGANLEIKTLDKQYDLTNSGPIMYLPN